VSEAAVRVRAGRRFLACLGVGAAWMAATPALADDVATLVTTVCNACHMPDGNSVVPMFPKLAGQQAEYLEKQLADYITGKRPNDVMAPVIAQIKPGDIKGLAAFYAGQKPAPGTVNDAALAEAGRKLYEDGNEESGVPACVGCHQPAGEGNPRYPRLAGQHQAYTSLEMQDFKTGVRANDKGKVMRAVADRMTEAEIYAVAEYLAGL
jgi:cytochrome c553